MGGCMSGKQSLPGMHKTLGSIHLRKMKAALVSRGQLGKPLTASRSEWLAALWTQPGGIPDETEQRFQDNRAQIPFSPAVPSFLPRLG